MHRYEFTCMYACLHSYFLAVWLACLLEFISVSQPVRSASQLYGPCTTQPKLPCNSNDYPFAAAPQARDTKVRTNGLPDEPDGEEFRGQAALGWNKPCSAWASALYFQGFAQSAHPERLEVVVSKAPQHSSPRLRLHLSIPALVFFFLGRRKGKRELVGGFSVEGLPSR